MNNFILNLECICGSDIKEAIRQACIISGNIGVMVKFKFNGIEVLVKHDGNNGSVLDRKVEHYYDLWRLKILKTLDTE